MKFGMFRTRVSFASCAPTEEVASAVFAFFNDGSDANGNGIVDNPEMDFQVLCGTPTFIVPTCWSDFEQATATTPERFIKRSHAVDMSTGTATTPLRSDTRSPDDNRDRSVDPAFPARRSTRWVSIGAVERAIFHREPRPRDALWTLADPKLIPRSLQFILNLWHPTEHSVPAALRRTSTGDTMLRALGRVLEPAPWRSLSVRAHGTKIARPWRASLPTNEKSPPT